MSTFQSLQDEREKDLDVISREIDIRIVKSVDMSVVNNFIGNEIADATIAYIKASEFSNLHGAFT